MKRKIMLIIGILMVTSTLLVANAKISAQEEKPVVVTTTSVIASVVEDLAGDSVEASYLVPPSLCPGHYDIRPSDVDLISKADLILKHGIMGEYWLSDLIDSANESGTLSVPVVSVGTSWNTPSATRDIYTNVANALEQYLDLEVENRLSKCLEAINVTESTLKDIASQYGFNNTPVVVMLWQKTFVEYLGFKVVATYGPPDKISEQDIVEVEENATKEGAIMVIDNLHSGTSTGEKIAEDINAVHVVLLNFPGVVPEAQNLTTMMIYNAKLLAEALNNYEYIVQVQRLSNDVALWRNITIALVILAAVEAVLIALMIVKGKKTE